MAGDLQELSVPNLGDLELGEFSVGDDPLGRARFALPVSADTGAAGSVVYLEIDPGNHIPPHAHSAEETVLVLVGEGVATAGDREGAVSAGSIVVVPAFVRHGFENTGSVALRAVGFFGANVVINTFDEPVAPFGVSTVVTPVVE